jgi:hypothetical protein
VGCVGVGEGGGGRGVPKYLILLQVLRLSSITEVKTVPINIVPTNAPYMYAPKDLDHDQQGVTM